MRTLIFAINGVIDAFRYINQTLTDYLINGTDDIAWVAAAVCKLLTIPIIGLSIWLVISLFI